MWESFRIYRHISAWLCVGMWYESSKSGLSLSLLLRSQPLHLCLCGTGVNMGVIVQRHGDVGQLLLVLLITRIDGKVVEAPLKTKNSYRSVSIGC